MRRGADLVNAGCRGLSRLHMDGHWNEDNLLLRRWRMLMVMDHGMLRRCLHCRELRVRRRILLVDEGGVVRLWLLLLLLLLVEDLSGARGRVDYLRLGAAHLRRQEALRLALMAEQLLLMVMDGQGGFAWVLLLDAVHQVVDVDGRICRRQLLQTAPRLLIYLPMVRIWLQRLLLMGRRIVVGAFVLLCGCFPPLLFVLGFALLLGGVQLLIICLGRGDLGFARGGVLALFLAAGVDHEVDRLVIGLVIVVYHHSCSRL